MLDNNIIFQGKPIYLQVGKLVPLGIDVEVHAVHGSRQRKASNQQNKQNQEGKRGREVNYFPH